MTQALVLPYRKGRGKEAAQHRMRTPSRSCVAQDHFKYASAPCRCHTQCLHVALAEVLHRCDYEPAQPEHTKRKFCQLSDDVAVLQSWCDTGSVLPRPTLEAAKVGFRTLVPLFTYLPSRQPTSRG